MVETETNVLRVTGSLGFNSKGTSSVVVHPSDLHLLWAQGSLLVVKSIGNELNSYMSGHEGQICTVACSKNGALVASGEEHSAGSRLRASLIVWDFDKRSILYRVRYHEQAILKVVFSCDSQYLVSLGGHKDGHDSIAWWNMLLGHSETVHAASDQLYQEATDLTFFNKDSSQFVTTHNSAIKFWRFDSQKKRLSHFDCPLGHIKRFINCVAIDPQDQFLYCGTRHGDILKIIVSTGRYHSCGPV